MSDSDSCSQPHCSQCGAELSLSPGSVIGRTEECPQCQADIHACVQCRFYDASAYNECSEPQAERVVEKERGNFCDYFELGSKNSPGSQGNSKANALQELEDLFKK